MLVEEIRRFMEDKCRHGTGPFDISFFQKHTLVMAAIADALAQRYHADHDVVALAAYLHDISAVEDYATVPRHHILGGDRAEEILAGFGYPKEKMDEVRQCILTHSSPVAIGQGTLEEVCISNADAASQILMPGYWLHYAFTAKGFSYEKGLAWYRNGMASHYEKMTEDARVIVEDTYHAGMFLFAAEMKA